MSLFDFVMVLYSVILGLSVTTLLTSIGHFIQNHRTVRLYSLHTAWVALFFLYHVFLFFNAWAYSRVDVWQYYEYVLFLAAPTLLYLVSVLTFPEAREDAMDDLHGYYYDRFRWALGQLAAVVVISVLNEKLILDRAFLRPENALRSAVVLLLVGATSSQRPLVHWTCLGGSASVLIVAVYSLRGSIS